MTATPLTPADEPSESAPIAHEIARSVERYIHTQAEVFDKSSDDSLAQLKGSGEVRSERALQGDPKSFSWLDHYALAKQDPERALQRWQEVKAAAQQELQSGHRAAIATEGTISASAWQRAQFLAIHNGLTEEWKPQNGIERSLIDMMAQAFSTQLFWQERMMCYACLEVATDRAKHLECIQHPRLSDAQAVDQAAQLVDRFNRIFMRSLRALRDLRRHTPTLVVHKAAQLNVAENQVHLDLG